MFLLRPSSPSTCEIEPAESATGVPAGPVGLLGAAEPISSAAEPLPVARAPEARPPADPSIANLLPRETPSIEFAARGETAGKKAPAARGAAARRPVATFVDGFHGASTTAQILLIPALERALRAVLVPRSGFDILDAARDAWRRATGLDSHGGDATLKRHDGTTPSGAPPPKGRLSALLLLRHRPHDGRSRPLGPLLGPCRKLNENV